MSGRLTENKIILIKRRTRLEELIVRYNTIQQAQFYIERLGADFSDYLQEDAQYRQAISRTLNELEVIGRVQLLDREHVPNFIFGEQDVVVVLGQDGLVANTLKYVEHQPLIGVNPDPLRWDGVLLPFTVGDLKLVVPDVLRRRRPIKEVTLAKAQLNDGQVMYGVNDLFIGRKTHVSARYQLKLESYTEQHSSSGIIVSTGLGSTGWLRSIMAGAAGIMRAVTCKETGAHLDRQDERLAPVWDAPSLRFSVREPFPSRTTSAELVFGEITDGRPLRITSQMPEDGVIFSDGVESDYLEFNAGVEAVIGPAERKGRLVH
ncbi:sugar kinase [Paenibacillus sp. JX-17]|uniref:Sugar kinase n=1 Tax=Paenibacillus lacisoli TaxID=3064525 RepID=A0ABT9C9P4_9BACL|nr:sugar kinase [Paenibacillus sp. JX-17]MDO7905962.1 sugar kinase [Paenibacillus sp. JX-17]